MTVMVMAGSTSAWALIATSLLFLGSLLRQSVTRFATSRLVIGAAIAVVFAVVIYADDFIIICQVSEWELWLCQISAGTICAC